jgi:hypothetical protein
MEIRVTKKAVFRRLQNFLQAKGQYLRSANRGRHLRNASRGTQERKGLGDYFLVGAKGLIEHDVDIEKMARELGLLDPWETLIE